MKEEISDHCVDAVVDLLFRAVPAMDSEDLVDFMEALLAIVGRERAEAVEEEKRRWLTKMNPSSS